MSAMINNRQVCSDILGASLPSSTYISDVQVTTGTEEQKVVVRWKVESPDTEHDIYYRVLRRIVGETDWVTLSSSTHGTFNEYEYTDDRPQAGTYYEYAVQAFGALCDEQLKQSDMIVKPGFAQARGTITGHIAFGSGTAVQGVRVSLVRATAEQEGEQAQYFSRSAQRQAAPDPAAVGQARRRRQQPDEPRHAERRSAVGREACGDRLLPLRRRPVGR